MNTEILKSWNSLTREEKIERIQSGIEYNNTNHGFLMLQYWRKENEVGVYITSKLSNHLCVEAVSQDTLISLFGDDHEYEEQDAEVILNWMDAQK